MHWSAEQLQLQLPWRYFSHNILFHISTTTSSGYKGRNCEININECDPNPCLNDAACVDGINGYTCNCNDGFTGTNCEVRHSKFYNLWFIFTLFLFSQINIDECDDHLCENNSTCMDDINKYKCECMPGYTGTLCEEEINECEPR